jgi:protein-tyrosine phosphatase
MAEALAKQLLAERIGCRVEELPDRGFHVSSAGVNGGVGGATERAIETMNRRGLDVSNHRSTFLTRDMIQQADFVFAMTGAHMARIIDLTPSAADRVSLLIEGKDVHDPIGGSADEYGRCAKNIEQGLRARLERIAI